MRSTKDKYIKIVNEQNQGESDEHEIKITSKGNPSRYISRAATLFLEQNFDFVVLRAAGRAIKTLCQVSEIIRKRIKGLHIINKITNTVIEDVFQPTEEGLDVVKVSRNMSVFEIKLTRSPTAEEKNHYGYQDPLPDEEIEELKLDDIRRGGGGERRGRGRYGRGGRYGDRGNRRGFRGGRGRGGRYPRNDDYEYDEEEEDYHYGGRRRGRGYGRRGDRGYGRGYGRGGYGRGGYGRGGYGRGGFGDRDSEEYENRRGNRRGNSRGYRGRGDFGGDRRGGRGRGFQKRGGQSNKQYNDHE